MIKGGTDATIKFLIYLLIFLIVVFAFVFLFVIPSIKGYKNAKVEYHLNTKEYKNLQNEQIKLKEKLNGLKENNKNIIDIFSKEFDRDKFITFSKNYFDDVRLIEIDSEVNSSALKVYQFSADIKAQNPKRFYNFVKDLKSYDGLVKINFPINISSKNSLLQINFHMSVYSMNMKNRKLNKK